jgi:Asp-tRNA(Asn)/Glu-tRNA(Gln) amidotransferase C subunit
MVEDVMKETNHATQEQLEEVMQNFNAQFKANMNNIQINIAEIIVEALREDAHRRNLDGIAKMVVAHAIHVARHVGGNGGAIHGHMIFQTTMHFPAYGHHPLLPML